MIGRSLVSGLCFTDILLEMLVEFFKVDCEFMSASGDERVFGVNGDVRSEFGGKGIGGECMEDVLVELFSIKG